MQRLLPLLGGVNRFDRDDGAFTLYPGEVVAAHVLDDDAREVDAIGVGFERGLPPDFDVAAGGRGIGDRDGDSWIAAQVAELMAIISQADAQSLAIPVELDRVRLWGSIGAKRGDMRQGLRSEQVGI